MSTFLWPNPSGANVSPAKGIGSRALPKIHKAQLLAGFAARSDLNTESSHSSPLERSSRSESSFAIGKLYDAENLQQSADQTSAAHCCHEKICFQSRFM